MYEIFSKLLSERNLKTADVVKATGIPASTFSDWKSNKSKPKIDKLKKIADYFGVSLEYLQTGISSEKKIFAIDLENDNMDEKKYNSIQRILKYSLLFQNKPELLDIIDKYINLEPNDADHVDYMINVLYDSKHKDTDNDNK